MQALTLDNLAIVAAVAFASPLLLGFAARLRVPSVEARARVTCGRRSS